MDLVTHIRAGQSDRCCCMHRRRLDVETIHRREGTYYAMSGEIRVINRPFCLHSAHTIRSHQHRFIRRLYSICYPAAHTESTSSADCRCLGRSFDQTSARVLLSPSTSFGQSARSRHRYLTTARCWGILSCEEQHLWGSKRANFRVDSTGGRSLERDSCLRTSAQSCQPTCRTTWLEICLSKLAGAAGTQQS